MISHLIALLGLTLFASITTSCSEDEPGGVIACIDEITTGTFGEPTQFTSCSENASSLLWTFPDGSTSSADNPVFTLQQLVNNTVQLTATDDQGNSNQTSTIVSFSEGTFGVVVGASEGITGVRPLNLAMRSSDYWLLTEIIESGGNNFGLVKMDDSFSATEEFNDLVAISGAGNFPSNAMTAIDGGIYIRYFTHTASGDLFKLLKISASGQVEWQYTSPLEPAVFAEDATGNLVSFGTQNDKLQLINIMATGDVSSQLELNVSGSGFKLRDVVETSDGFALVGDLQGGGDERDILAMEVTGDGNILWSTKIGEDNGSDDIGNAIDVASNGVVISGTEGGEAVFAHIHGSGEVMAKTSLDEARGLDIISGQSGEVYVSVGGSNGLGQFAKLLRLEIDGTVSWKRSLSSHEDSAIVDIAETDGGLTVLIALSQTENVNTTTKVKIVRVSKEGLVLN